MRVVLQFSRRCSCILGDYWEVGGCNASIKGDFPRGLVLASKPFTLVSQPPGYATMRADVKDMLQKEMAQDISATLSNSGGNGHPLFNPSHFGSVPVQEQPAGNCRTIGICCRCSYLRYKATLGPLPLLLWPQTGWEICFEETLLPAYDIMKEELGFHVEYWQHVGHKIQVKCPLDACLMFLDHIIR